jgi:hypothetical protein
MASAAPAAAGPADLDALLGAAGVTLAAAPPDAAERHPDVEWAASGAMALTGEAAGEPLLAPAPLASRARRCVEGLRSLARGGELDGLDGAALLGERAALLGLSRRGAVSPGGACRLLRAADGWLAVNLPRPDDLASLPAWLETAHEGADPWARAARGAARAPVARLVERARLLGLAVAPAGEPPRDRAPWGVVAARGRPRRGPARRAPLVVDLSALWAGPLCAQLLRLAGAGVWKLESSGRPDGARAGAPAFFDLLNAGKRSIALDLGCATGRAWLARVLACADIVVESSRPRALRQLGIEAEAWLRGAPGRVWVSLTGYGRREPEAGWVAFGDDAAAAAGLAAATGTPARPLFCGDAVADPLAGLHAALAALAAWRLGESALLDVSLVGVVAHALASPARVREGRVCRGARVREGRVCRGAQAGAFEVELRGERFPVRPPRARAPSGRARPLGADTQALLAEVAAGCGRAARAGGASAC